MNKLVFIIGMRRSGTSITRELVRKHPNVVDILFEPHELLFSCQSIHISRYRNSQYHQEAIRKFREFEAPSDKWFGAKIAVNCGIEAMNWKWLEDKFDKPTYIFTHRDARPNYASWVNVDHDQPRGIVPMTMYFPWWGHINVSFAEFVRDNPDRAVVVKYEKLLENTDGEMNKVWDLLGLERLKNLDRFIKQPKYNMGNS